jgi:peptide subunit release factor 1 (eRF1)
MVSRVNFLETTPERMDDVARVVREEEREASDAKARQIRPRVEEGTGGTMRAVERYEVLFFDVPS